MTDNELVLAALEYHQGRATTNEILVYAFAERGHGVTVHSRIADLRKQGHKIVCGRDGCDRRGRPTWVYTLVREPEQLELSA